MKKNITSKANALLMSLLFLTPAIWGCSNSMESEGESSDIKIEMAAMLVDSYCDCLKEKTINDCEDESGDKMKKAMKYLIKKDLMGDSKEEDRLLISSELKKLEEKYKKCKDEARKK